MAIQHAKLADIAYVASSAGSVYTNPASTKSFLKGLILFNGNTTTETVKIYCVPDSSGSLGTAGVANQVAELSVATKETVYLPLNVDGFPLTLTDTNDAIFASTTTASKVTVIPIGDKE
jgi:hypothetical protein